MTSRLEEIPEPLDLGDTPGRSVWHENAEILKLRRPMTPEEWQDHLTYDRARYRVREADRKRRAP